MPVSLDHREVAVQRQPVEHVADLAEPATDPGRGRAVAQHQPVGVAAALGGPADQLPERERLARGHEHAVDAARGQAEVRDLVALQLRVHALQVALEDRGVLRDEPGQVGRQTGRPRTGTRPVRPAPAW